MRLGVNGRFYGAPVTGVQRFAREVVARLALREDVTLLLPADVGERADLPWGVRAVRGRLAGRLWEQAELPFAAARADVVLHPANAAPAFGPPGVVVLHDVLPLSHPAGYRPLYRLWARTVHARAARRARTLVTVSRWSAGEISRRLGIPPERIRVVRQAPGPFEAPAAEVEVADMRARYGIRGPYFLCVGGGDPRKGLDLLRAVWGSGGVPGAELVEVGARSPTVHPGAAPGSSGVRSLGRVSDDDLRALYTGAVALLFPSVAEGFGRPPLEALACGTRVVAAPCPAQDELLGDAVDLAPLEAHAWTRALHALLEEPPGRRRERVARGRVAAGALSWDRAADEVAAACREAAGIRP